MIKNMEKRFVVSMVAGMTTYVCLTIGLLLIHGTAIGFIHDTLQVQQEEYEETIGLLNERIDGQNQVISNLQQQNEYLKQKVNE